MSHTVDWKVRLHLFEERGTTKAHATVDTGTTTITGTGVAECAPGDRDIPEIGDEFAAGRALRHLGDQLVHIAEHDVEAVGAAPEHRNSTMYGWSL
ncbi:dsRBD fold-containing protein [Streptomyces netropsis]|uniref:dsRBD fold-containing protein n=1 Tax=Streptomyces netropsis TaxID=55404 RepID=UPI0037ADBCB9